MDAREKTAESRYRTASFAGAAPVVPVAEAPRGVVAKIRRAIVSWAKTAALTLGTMWVIGGVVISIGVPAISRNRGYEAGVANEIARTHANEALRRYGLAPDPAITAAAAGAAFQRMQPPPQGTSLFKQRLEEPKSAAPWRDKDAPGALFGDASQTTWSGPLYSLVLPLAAKGMTPQQREFLRVQANAPIWRDFDLVARAPALDFVGRYVIPFDPKARVFDMPIARYAGVKELAYVGVTRAAWHLAEGRRDSAEAILRSIISFGTVIEASGPFRIDALIGNVIVSIGATGLRDFYVVTHDPRAAEISPLIDRRQTMAPPPVVDRLLSPDFETRRAAMTDVLHDPSLPLGFRTEMLRDLENAACASPIEFVFGPSAELRNGYAYASSEMARYPSERALVDLIRRSYAEPLPEGLVPGMDQPLRLINIVGKLYFNPRVARCMLVSSGIW